MAVRTGSVTETFRHLDTLLYVRWLAQVSGSPEALLSMQRIYLVKRRKSILCFDDDTLILNLKWEVFY